MTSGSSDSLSHMSTSPGSSNGFVIGEQIVEVNGVPVTCKEDFQPAMAKAMQEQSVARCVPMTVAQVAGTTAGATLTELSARAA